MKQWKTPVSVICVFLLGAVAGGLVTYRVCQQNIENIMRDDPRTMRELIVRRLQHKLNLDPGQLEQLRAIVRETHAEMKTVRRRFRPEIDQILERSQAKVRAFLRPDQLERYDRIVAERRRKREINDNDK